MCAAAREVTNHRIGAGSHPASDTDDNMWEELLQGPDSASTGSSDTEGDEGLNAEVNFSQNTTQSSDEETPQQGITSVNPLRPSEMLCDPVEVHSRVSGSDLDLLSGSRAS